MPFYPMDRMPSQDGWEYLFSLIPPLWRRRKELNIQELKKGDLVRIKSGQHIIILEVVDPSTVRTKVISHLAGTGVYKFLAGQPQPGSTIYLPILRRGMEVELHGNRFRELRLATKRSKK